VSDPIGDPLDDPNAPHNIRNHPADGYTRVWTDDQNYIDWDDAYVESMYVDNNVVNFAIQPDVWTLDIDSQPITFFYSGGHELRLPQLGTILDSYDGPSRAMVMGNGLIVATDRSGNPMYNAFTTPRLWWLRWELHRQIRELAEQRLELAQVVHAFSQIIAQYSSLDGTASTAFKGPIGTGW
jgi:hypothetical protein